MRPTQLDVARRAGVSRALVSIVMRNGPNVSEASRSKVLQAADELGYRTNAFARGLASKRLDTIGVLVNDVTNPYFGGLYTSLAAAAEKAGYDILTAPGTGGPSSEAALVNTLLEHRVAGVVLLSPLMPVASLRSIAASCPTVVVGREVPNAKIDVVTTDERSAADSVVSRLVALGHRHLVHITGGDNRPARDRARALSDAMAKAGVRSGEVAGDFGIEGGRAGARLVLDLRPRPTAVIAPNDLSAVAALGVFKAAGLQVPQDISVVGYDDSQLAQLDLINLTSVRQQVDQFGQVAMSSLMRRIAEPEAPRSIRRIETDLVERATTGSLTHPARRRA